MQEGKTGLAPEGFCKVIVRVLAHASVGISRPEPASACY